VALLVAAARCSSTDSVSCFPDANGVSGGARVIDVVVTDTAFSVGSADAAFEPNITVENLATVQLTVQNAGTKPHDFVVDCLPTPNSAGCPAESCFPAAADLPAIAPGQSASTTFMTPAHEGSYRFSSDLPGDVPADGGATSLVGAFVLM
jgi:hypothetical protein